jgi:hypothetical protein
LEANAWKYLIGSKNIEDMASAARYSEFVAAQMPLGVFHDQRLEKRGCLYFPKWFLSLRLLLIDYLRAGQKLLVLVGF